MYSNESAMDITEEEFEETVNNSHKLVVVDFYAEWCMPCVMMSPLIEELAEDDSMQEVKFVKINVEDNQELAEKHKVSSVPCLLFFKSGKEVDRIIGMKNIEVIENKINNHIK